MKRFDAPNLTIVHLTNEDVIVSSLCSSKTCTGFDCHDCPTECSDIYHCGVQVCPSYKD